MQNLEQKLQEITQIIPQMQAEIASLKLAQEEYERIIAEKDAYIEHLKTVIRNLQRMLFGQRSEQTKLILECPDQMMLEGYGPVEVPQAPPEEIVVPEYKKRKSKRSLNEMMDALPNEDVVYDVPEEQRFDAEGNPLEYMGKDLVRRELHSEPQKLKVINIYVKTYGSKRDSIEQARNTIVKGNVPAALIPHSYASASLVADVLTKKYVYSLPLYRQCKLFQELGVDFSRNTLANWVITATGQYLRPYYSYLKKALLEQKVIHADETTLQVLKEPNKAPSTKSQFWVYTTASRCDKQISCYEYRDSRAAHCAEEFLKGYSGALITDGYSGYIPLGDKVTRGACWAHLRRYWHNAFPTDYKKSGAKREQLDETTTEQNAKDPTCVIGFKYCNAVFALEKEFANLSPEERKRQRREKTKPLIEQFYQFVEGISHPGGALAKAVTYAMNQRKYLCAFLENGDMDISNNAAERSIRNCVIGRKNWLFSDTPAGAEASAIAYSVMATAKLNNLSVYNYVRHLLETISRTAEDELPQLLPTLMPWASEMQSNFLMKPGM